MVFWKPKYFDAHQLNLLVEQILTDLAASRAEIAFLQIPVSATGI